jgi:hypothetical protein
MSADIRDYDHILWVVFSEDENAQDATEVAEDLGILDQWTAYDSLPEDASEEARDDALEQERDAVERLHEFYRRVHRRMAERLDEDGYGARVVAESEIGSEAARLSLHAWRAAPEDPNPQVAYHAMARQVVDIPDLFETAEQDVLAEMAPESDAG